MPFEGRQTSVQVVEVAGSAPDLRTLPDDQLAQLCGNTFAMTRGTKRRELSGPGERKIERPEADQESEPLDVRRYVLPVAIGGSLGYAQEPFGLVEPNGLRRCARPASQFTDLHTQTVDLPVAGMSRAGLPRPRWLEATCRYARLPGDDPSA